MYVWLSVLCLSKILTTKIAAHKIVIIIIIIIIIQFHEHDMDDICLLWVSVEWATCPAGVFVLFTCVSKIYKSSFKFILKTYKLHADKQNKGLSLKSFKTCDC